MRSRNKKSTFVTLMLVFFSLVVSAQDHAMITGNIIDENGKAIGTALVQLKGTNYVTESDVDGKFSISVPVGKYMLIVSRIGFLQYSQSITLSNANLTLAKIKLQSFSDMAQVNIEGKTNIKKVKEQAFNVNVIDAKQLYNTSADLNQLLSKTSGVRIREDGGMGSNFSFSLNGFSGKQVKFFLDGIPMDNFGSSLTLNNIPVNMAERVEIYKGVLPINLGADALGGAVNIITRSNLNFTDVSYGYGSFNTHKMSINHANTNTNTGLTFRANAFYNYSDNNYKVNVKPIINNIRSDVEQEFERFHDGYESIGIQAEVGVTGKKYADKLLIGLIASGNDKEIQNGVTMDLVYGARSTRSFSLIPTLKYKKSNLFTHGLDFNFYAAYNTTANRFIDTARVKYDWFGQARTPDGATAEFNRTQLKNNDKEALATANLAYHFSDHHALSFNYAMTDYRRKSSDVENPDNITYLYPQQLNKQILGLAWQANYEKFTGTVFSKLYLQNAKSFEQVANGTGIPDYQASTTNTNDFGYGAAVAYFILANLQAKASYEHTYRLPEAIELLGDGLFVRRNSELKAENSDNFNFGALYSFNFGEGHRLGFEANYILRSAHDYIRLNQQQSQPVDRQYINIGDVRTNGLEGEIKYSWLNKFQAAVNMTYQDIIDKEEFYTSTNLTGTTRSPNLGYGYRIPNMPYLFGNADLGYTFHKLGKNKDALSLNYSLNYVQEYYLTPHHLGINNDDLIPRQFAHNVMVNYVLKDGRYNISAECRNLADNRLFDNYLLQKPGRSFFLKLRYFIAKN